MIFSALLRFLRQPKRAANQSKSPYRAAVDWRTVSPTVKKAARTYGAALIGKDVLTQGRPDQLGEGPDPYGRWEIAEATRARVHEIVIQAVDEGWTVNQLQSKIIHSEGLSADCALTIAWTEKALALSGGEYESALSAGLKYKKWITASGDCATCKANAKQGRIPIRQPFESGAQYPPGHTRCRCSAGYYLTKDGR